MSYRTKAVEAAKAMKDARYNDRIAAFLTEEERDWMLLLEERLFAIYNGRTEAAP